MTRLKKHPAAFRPQGSRPVVAVVLRRHETLDADTVQVLIEESRQRNWCLVNPALAGGALLDHQVPSGAITTALPDSEMVAALRAKNVPLIRIGRLPHPDDAQVPAVLPDHAAVGRIAATYFLERGFRHLACFTHAGNHAMRLTLAAFNAVTEAHGASVHAHNLQNPPPASDALPPSDRFDERMRKAAEWLLALPKPVAILTHADEAAAHLILVCQRLNLPVPEKIAVLGLGNQEVWCELAPIPISSIDPDRREQTRVAIRLLDQRMRGEMIDADPHLVAPLGVMTRRSTDILAVSDTMVARAIRYVWDHLDRELSVGDVARAMQVPRHKLDRAFRVNLGRGVKAELIRIRMERCCEMLRDTDEPIAALAEQLGYRTVQYLHNSFKKTYDISPRQYRLRSRGETETETETETDDLPK